MHNPWTSPGSVCGDGTNIACWPNCRTDYALLTYIPLKSFSISVVVSSSLCTNKFLPAIRLSWDSSGHALLGIFCWLLQAGREKVWTSIAAQAAVSAAKLNSNHSSSQAGQLLSHLPIRGSSLECGRRSLAQSWQELGTTSWERVSAPLLSGCLWWGAFSLSLCH